METIQSTPLVLERLNCNKTNEEDTLKIHSDSTVLLELHECQECDMRFSHHRILEMHLQVHKASHAHKKCSARPTLEDRDASLPEATVDERCRVSDTDTIASTESNDKWRSKQHHLNVNAVKRGVGLTKLRLEDYLRCDECSCIYLEEVDYHKHMTNFHKLEAANQKKKRVKRKAKCESCCKNCKCNENHLRTNLSARQVADSISPLHCNIKYRWSKLMKGMHSTSTMGTRSTEGTKPYDSNVCSLLEVKTEPEDDTLDYCHLLSQVEVHIKTEPLDDAQSDCETSS